MSKDQTTTPGTSCATLYDECVGSLTSPADHNSGDAGGVDYRFLPLFKKAKTLSFVEFNANAACFCFNYFKTLSVSPVCGSNPQPPAQYSGTPLIRPPTGHENLAVITG